jgi:hypothetical protein
MWWDLAASGDRWEGADTDEFTWTVQESDRADQIKIRCIITDASGKSVTSDEVLILKKSESSASDPSRPSTVTRPSTGSRPTTGSSAVRTLTITTQPGNKYCAEDETVTLTVAVSGGKEPYKYVWQKYSRGWNNVSGATSSAITAGIGEYRCIITDADGTKVTTSNATVILKDVGVNVVFEGVTDGYAKLTAYVSGGKAPYKYHWNTGTVVTISDKSHSIWVKEGREGVVSCFVTDSLGNKSSESIQIDPEWFD